MKIHICNIGPPDIFDRKSDIIFGLLHALESLGHNASVGSNIFDPSSINIVIGSDLICGGDNVMNFLKKASIEYVVYEVENFNGQTINYRKDFPIGNYKQFLENAKFILTPYKYNLPKLSEVVGGEKVHYCKWGFHEKMINTQFCRNQNTEFEALFFGLVKGTRLRKLQKLQSVFGKSIKVINEKIPFSSREYFISRSNLGLSLSYGATDDFVNPFRIYHMVANGLPVLSDHEIDHDNYLDICFNSNFDTLLENIKVHPANFSELRNRCESNKLASNLKPYF